MKTYSKKKEWPLPESVPGATWVRLTRGRCALVDDADAPVVNAHHWHITSWGYAARTVKLPNGKQSSQSMHRFLVPCESGMEVDHANRDRLDNRRSNLRVATHAQNQQNAIKSNHGPLSVRGVRAASGGRWRAVIKSNRRRIDLGLFGSKSEAADAYRRASAAYHGEFSLLRGSAGG